MRKDISGEVRRRKATMLKNSVLKLGENSFAVPSEKEKGKGYIVQKILSCSCPDFIYRGGKCKHILAVEMSEMEKI